MDWNALVAATLTLYRQAAKETVEKVGKGWWVALLPLVYTPLIFLAATFFGRMGLAGGLLVGLVMALCTGSYLYFIDGVVHGQRVQPQELFDSWRALLWLGDKHFVLPDADPPAVLDAARRGRLSGPVCFSPSRSPHPAQPGHGGHLPGPDRRAGHAPGER